jgi:hypothetical protein
MYCCFDKRNIFINSLIFLLSKMKIFDKASYPYYHHHYLKLMVSFFLLFIFIFNLSFNYNSIFVYGHSLLGGGINASGIQTQTNGNYKVELSTNPSKLVLNKTTDIQLRVTSTAAAGGAEIMELPVYLSLQKDGKNDNSSQTLVMVRGGHYNFKSIFPEKGKYILFVNIKDIYYTDTTLNFIFELNVNDPIIDQFYNLMKSYLIDYYYIYVPIVIIIVISIIAHKSKGKTKNTEIFILIVRGLYKKLHKQ